MKTTRSDDEEEGGGLSHRQTVCQKTVMKSGRELQLLAFAIACFLPIHCPQSIPLIASPSQIKSDFDGPNSVRFPGGPFPGSGAMPPPPPGSLPQGSNPIVNILGNLLGGLGAFAMNPVGVSFPSSPPLPGRFPPTGSGRLVQRPEPAIECSPPSSPHVMRRASSGQRPAPDSANDASNNTGVCVPTPFDCRGRGGRLLGPCLRFHGPNAPPQVFGACCSFEVSCGQEVRVNGTHFKSPNFPNPYPSPGSCQVAVKNIHNNICQIRLDFIVFNLKQPVLGNCNSDRFVVSGQSNNDIIPSLCGYNPDQHSTSLTLRRSHDRVSCSTLFCTVYVEVDEASRGQFSPSLPSTLLTLNVITSGSRNRWFDIKISYIACDSPYRGRHSCFPLCSEQLMLHVLPPFPADNSTQSLPAVLLRTDWTGSLFQLRPLQPGLHVLQQLGLHDLLPQVERILHSVLQCPTRRRGGGVRS